MWELKERWRGAMLKLRTLGTIQALISLKPLVRGLDTAKLPVNYKYKSRSLRIESCGTPHGREAAVQLQMKSSLRQTCLQTFETKKQMDLCRA